MGRLLWFSIWFMALMFASCANIQGISGGPEDDAAPRWVSDLSSPPYQLNFRERSLRFTFDEWIRLDNPSSQIFISPTTSYPLNIKLKGKTLVVSLDDQDSLRPNTTYTLQFGKSIKDITKGNVLTNFKYVFSTGNYLDSLKIHGKVLDAFSQAPMKQTVVSLYTNPEDSAFEKTKPDYYILTDESGNYQLDYLSPGCYRLYAVEDKNQNYFYDQNNESIAFQKQCVTIDPSQPDPFILLQANLQSYPIQIKERNLQAGWTRIQLNRSVRDSIRWMSRLTGLYFARSTDSATVWNTTADTQYVVLSIENFTDTLPVFSNQNIHPDTMFHLRATQSVISPRDSLVIFTQYPLRQINSALFTWDDSSLVISRLEIDALDPRKLKIFGNWKPGTPLALYCLQGAVQNCFGQKNESDTLRFQIPPQNTYATLNVQMDSASGKNLIAHLIFNEQIVRSKKIQLKQATEILQFTHLAPGNYRLRMIEDLNFNGVWDPSDFKNKLQAEPVYYFTMPELRADWEVKANVKL